jgi:hypothetical protein
LIGMPITANIIQIAKQTVNAIVLAASTDHRVESAVIRFSRVADLFFDGMQCDYFT